jgi:hypothetical protein
MAMTWQLWKEFYNSNARIAVTGQLWGKAIQQTRTALNRTSMTLSTASTGQIRKNCPDSSLMTEQPGRDIYDSAFRKKTNTGWRHENSDNKRDGQERIRAKVTKIALLKYHQRTVWQDPHSNEKSRRIRNRIRLVKETFSFFDNCTYILIRICTEKNRWL